VVGGCTPANTSSSKDEDTKAYRPGWRLFALATRATETHLAHTGAPFLRKVVAGLNETSHLCVLRRQQGTDATQRAGVACIPWDWLGGNVCRPVHDIGGPHQATPTSAPSAIRDNVADWPPPPRVTLAGLLDHVDAIRRHGYGSVDEEFEPGLVGVSAPVYGFRGDIIAAINVSAPKQRLGAHLDEAGKFTRSIADQMSTALGAP
jgi:DNA-binding IclR family transcriptional regulator